MNRLIAATLLCLLPLPALAAGSAEDTARTALREDYARQARQTIPGFSGFSAAEGEALFRSTSAAGDARTPSCTSCHTSDPRQPGRNAKTGRPIEPVAVSVNPKRFTDAAEVEKHFQRDCKSVLGRDCTLMEKGNYLTWMSGQ